MIDFITKTAIIKIRKSEIYHKGEPKMKKFKLFLSWFSLSIVVLYSGLNIIATLIYLFSTTEIVAFPDFVEFVFGMDLVSWFVFGAFAIITFLIKVFFINENESDEKLQKSKNINILLHFIFMVLGFMCIYFLFKKGF